MMVGSKNPNDAYFKKLNRDPLYSGLENTRKLEELPEEERKDYIDILRDFIEEF